MANSSRYEEVRSDAMNLDIEVAYSNIGDEFIAEAFDEDAGKWVAVGKGKTRPAALRELADALEKL